MEPPTSCRAHGRKPSTVVSLLVGAIICAFCLLLVAWVRDLSGQSWATIDASQLARGEHVPSPYHLFTCGPGLEVEPPWLEHFETMNKVALHKYLAGVISPHDCSGLGGQHGLSATDFRHYVETGLALLKLQDRQRLFEVGTGCGGYLYFARQVLPGLHVAGVDMSENMLKVARAAMQDTKNGPFCQANASAYDFVPDNYMDGVVASAVLEYMPSLVETERALAGMLRVVKPGSRVLVTLLNDPADLSFGHKTAISDKLWIPRDWWSQVATRLPLARLPQLYTEADIYQPRAWWQRANRYSVLLTKL